ncbi:MAG: hypothetical protein ACI92G_002864 [Candidatus Pelagisphaera sp.]|jgi:hypothetical protein
MFARKMLLIFFGKRTILAGLDVAKEFFQSETSEVSLGPASPMARVTTRFSILTIDHSVKEQLDIGQYL